MFTSKQPGHFPRDPQPYVLTLPYVTPQRAARFTFTGGQGGERVEFAPRPEFNTPMNPILQDVRLGIDTVDSMLEYLQDGFGATARTDGLFTPEAIEHARKVLTRLSRLEEK